MRKQHSQKKKKRKNSVVLAQAIMDSTRNTDMQPEEDENLGKCSARNSGIDSKAISQISKKKSTRSKKNKIKVLELSKTGATVRWEFKKHFASKKDRIVAALMNSPANVYASYVNNETADTTGECHVPLSVSGSYVIRYLDGSDKMIAESPPFEVVYNRKKKKKDTIKCIGLDEKGVNFKWKLALHQPKSTDVICIKKKGMNDADSNREGQQQLINTAAETSGEAHISIKESGTYTILYKHGESIIAESAPFQIQFVLSDKPDEKAKLKARRKPKLRDNFIEVLRVDEAGIVVEWDVSNAAAAGVKIGSQDVIALCKLKSGERFSTKTNDQEERKGKLTLKHCQDGVYVARYYAGGKIIAESAEIELHGITEGASKVKVLVADPDQLAEAMREEKELREKEERRKSKKLRKAQNLKQRQDAIIKGLDSEARSGVEEIKRLFDEFASRDTGRIKASDLSKVLEMILGKINPDELENLKKIANVKHDDDEVQFETFVEMMAQRMQKEMEGAGLF